MKIKKGQIDEVVLYEVELKQIFGTGVFGITAKLGYKANERPVGDINLSGLSSDIDEDLSAAVAALTTVLERVCVTKLLLAEAEIKESEVPRGLLPTKTNSGEYGDI